MSPIVKTVEAEIVTLTNNPMPLRKFSSLCRPSVDLLIHCSFISSMLKLLINFVIILTIYS